MGVRAVIFDMDGVLLDSEPIHFEATRELLAERGIDYSAAAGDNFFGCTDHEVFSVLKERYRLEMSEEELTKAWLGRVVPALPLMAAPLPGVPEVLHDLKDRGLRLALASSSVPAVIAASLKALGIGSLFEIKVSGHDVENGKPSPDIFLEAARRLGLPPAECVVVEDSSNGMRAALTAGMRCAVVPCSSTAHQDFSDASIRLRTLFDLPSWLDSLSLGRQALPE
jgi:HAD superfamily hydrolase (TIGR01509 family)